MHGVPCSSASAKKDERVANVGFIHRSLLTDSKLIEMSHIVGPVVARDTQIMDHYLGPNPQGTIINHAESSRMSQASGKAIYQAQVPPRRPSATECACSRNFPLDLIEQVDPFFDKLVALYFEHLYPCLPVLDEDYMMNQLGEKLTMPHTSLVNVSAYSLFYWHLSPELSLYPRPDQDFAWQVAVAANMSDIQKCDLATIVANTLNVAGRPSHNVINNTTSVSRIVALAHSIGLNHDCREWKIVEPEKRTRWKCWWVILIHDRWLNFAQGTPPYINKAYYDVPLPTAGLLTGGRGNILKHYQAAECYIELCRLTEIIGDILPLIYHIRSRNDGLAAEQTLRSEIELNRWFENRPDWLDFEDYEDRLPVPGLANLQLSYLSVQMLLRRIAWHEISQRDTDPPSSWLVSCQQAAEAIVCFVSTLKARDLSGFWLPYNAHHFTSAVTLLLRCGLQTSDPEIRRQSIASARSLVDCLRRFKDENNWDLAETALRQSETVLKRIDDALPRTPQAMPQIMATPTTAQAQQVDENFWENPALQYQGFGWQGQPEELFPGIFADFIADTALFEPQVPQFY
jgi:hypothetical protein